MMEKQLLHRRILTIAFALSVAGLVCQSRAQHQEQKSWQADSFTELAQKLEQGDGPYLRFLQKPSFNAGWYQLPAGGHDAQTPHSKDEIYYIADGRARLQVAADDIEIRPGSIVYVKARVPHRFHDIETPLAVLVLFANATPSSRDPDWLAYHIDQLKRDRKADANVWHPFLDVSTMRMGLYMLPRALGGDSTLVHKVDETNIVVSGRAQFNVGGDELTLQPGSVVWVEHGSGHAFHHLQDDLEVLILFQKSQTSD